MKWQLFRQRLAFKSDEIGTEYEHHIFTGH